MIGAIAVGIAAAVIAITLYHARSGHPIPWKNDTLYAVMLDVRDKVRPAPGARAEFPLFQLTLPDAKALYASKLPVHAVMTYRRTQVLTPSRAGLEPFGVATRLTTADFFLTFDVPFVYGSGWSRADDDAPDSVVVLSRFLNQKLFGGINSVGREVILDGHAHRVIGVLDAWMPRPRYYDLDSVGAFEVPEDVYIPFGWMETGHLTPNGRVTCLGPQAPITDFFAALHTGRCSWLQYWVELRGRAERDRFQTFVDNYTDEQRRHGRFPRPNNNRIVDVPTWLQMHDVVGDDSRMQLLLGLVFLLVCVFNTLGLLLARSSAAAPVYGLRRALGARRIDIVRAQLIEVALLGLMGGAAGLLLGYGGLALASGVLAQQLDAGRAADTDSVAAAMEAGSGNPDQLALAQSLAHIDASVLFMGLTLAVLTSLLVGLYPAWQAARLEPARFLKAQ